MNVVRSGSLIAAALASVVGYYTVSVHVSNERMAVLAARAAIARDMGEMRLLRADLRTRSRLPELQRWNEEVLGLAAPRAEQLMANPTMLASYAAPRPTPSTPPVAATVAVVRDALAPATLVRRASFTPRAARDLGTDAALAGRGGMAPGFQTVALR